MNGGRYGLLGVASVGRYKDVRVWDQRGPDGAPVPAESGNGGLHTLR